MKLEHGRIARAGARRALLAGALLLAGCAAREPLRLAIAGTPDGCQGARLAMEDVNRSGGVRGRRLELQILRELPTQSLADVAVRAQQFAADPRVLAVVGHAGSAASLAVAGIYNAAGVIQLAPTTTSPIFERAGPYSFTLVPDDNGQVAFLAREAGRDGSERVALVYQNDDYGRQIAAGLLRRLRARGAAVVFYAPYDPGQSREDRRVLGTSIRLHRPTTVFWMGGADALRAVLPRLRAALPRLRVYGPDAFDAPATYANADGALTGVRFVRFTDPSGGARIASLRNRYRAITGRDLTDEAVLSYDAVGVLAAALRSGAASREAVRRYLLSLGHERRAFPGVAGPIAFGALPSVARRYYLAEVTAHGVVMVRTVAGTGS